MKLPAVAIAAVFASGIAFGLSGVISGLARSQLFVGLFFALALTSLLAAVSSCTTNDSRSPECYRRFVGSVSE